MTGTGINQTKRRALQTTEVDGVPTFVVDTGQTPYACLSFRVGLADETFVNHGWTHLIEHLAMHHLTHPRISANASVDLTTTQFYVSGDRDDVVTFLRDLCRWLNEPDFTPLEHERDILAAESQQRSGGAVGLHLDYRFGPRGVGLLAYREMGLHSGDEAQLTDWTHTYFAAGNAALAMNCPPPPDLRLPLPTGRRQTLPEAAPLLGEAWPLHAYGAGTTTTASGLTTDPDLSPLVSSLICRAADDSVRHAWRASYGFTTSVHRIGAHRLMMELSGDIVPQRSTEAVELVSGVLIMLSRHGVPEQTLVDARDQLLRGLRDDPTALWQATTSARAALRGRGPVVESDQLERLRGVSTEEVDVQIREFATSMLVTSPAGQTSRTDVPFSSGAPEVTVPRDSRSWRSLREDKCRIHVTTDLAVVSSGSRSSTYGVELTRAVGLLKFPDGARTVVSRHGTTLQLEPNLWRKGEEAVALLDQCISPDVQLTMPPRRPQEIPARMSFRGLFRERLVIKLRQRGVLVRLLVPALVATVVAGGGVASHHGDRPESISTIQKHIASQMSEALGGAKVQIDCRHQHPQFGDTFYCTELQHGEAVHVVKVTFGRGNVVSWRTY